MASGIFNVYESKHQIVDLTGTTDAGGFIKAINGEQVFIESAYEDNGCIVIPFCSSAGTWFKVLTDTMSPKANSLVIIHYKRG